jgi:flagellar motor switch/type III secretory pathway protein FliN
MRFRTALMLAACTVLSVPAVSAQTLGYYQTPAINDEVLVFASEGDLWRAPATGGAAIRLTTHPEIEASPVLSPDGKWIAFNAAYDGPAEVYVMPVAGGAPVRLTHEGGDVTVRGWLDNSRVLYRTSNVPGTIPRLLRSIERETGKTEDIPLADADQATLLGDGKTIVFTRHGLSMFNDNAVQYRGGRLELMIPYATLEPVRELLLQMFMGEKFGRDSIWETHLASELLQTGIGLQAVLGEQQMTLHDAISWKVGSQIQFMTKPDQAIDLCCGSVPLFKGHLGQKNSNIAVKVHKRLIRLMTAKD